MTDQDPAAPAAGGPEPAKKPRKKQKNIHVPTTEQRSQVESMSAFGVPQDIIAKLIGISETTLKVHYKQEIALGLPKANLKVAGEFYKRCTGPDADPASQMYWLDRRAKWQPAEQKVKIDNNAVTIEELAKHATAEENEVILRVFERAAAAAIVGAGGKVSELQERA